MGIINSSVVLSCCIGRVFNACLRILSKQDINISSDHFASQNTDAQHKAAGSVYKSILSCDVIDFCCQSLLINYASVGRAPEAYGSHRVCLSVCVCVILLRAFLHDGKESSNVTCNAITARHSTTTKLARFLL